MRILSLIVVVVQLLHFHELVLSKTELNHASLIIIDLMEMSSAFGHGKIGFVGKLDLKHFPFHSSVDSIELEKIVVSLVTLLVNVVGSIRINHLSIFLTSMPLMLVFRLVYSFLVFGKIHTHCIGNLLVGSSVGSMNTFSLGTEVEHCKRLHGWILHFLNVVKLSLSSGGEGNEVWVFQELSCRWSGVGRCADAHLNQDSFKFR